VLQLADHEKMVNELLTGFPKKNVKLWSNWQSNFLPVDLRNSL